MGLRQGMAVPGDSSIQRFEIGRSVFWRHFVGDVALCYGEIIHLQKLGAEGALP